VTKKEILEVYWSMLCAHYTRRKVTLYFSVAIAAKEESLVTVLVTNVLIRFRIIAQLSKGADYFHRVVGLVVINIRQWDTPQTSAAMYSKRPINGHNDER